MSKNSKNALTHGVYAREGILPWEDPKAFDDLHQEIRRDLNPSGYLEEQTVRDIAMVHWRKRRLAISYALPFYKNKVTPELMEAAKGGIAGLAAYVADPAQRGTIMVSTEDMLRTFKANPDLVEAYRNLLKTAPPAKDAATQLDEPSENNRITAEIVEQAYDPVTLEKNLKIEIMMDNRIKSLMGTLVLQKTYQGMYGQKSIEVLPAVSESSENKGNDMKKH